MTKTAADVKHVQVDSNNSFQYSFRLKMLIPKVFHLVPTNGVTLVPIVDAVEFAMM